LRAIRHGATIEVMQQPLRLKYAARLPRPGHKPCPCSKYKAQNYNPAFRFLRHAATADDFMPLALTEEEYRQKCEGWALSFFDTEEHAIARWHDLADRLGSKMGGADLGVEEATRRLGDHVGKLYIAAADGLSGTPSRTGHFDIHEADGATFHGRVNAYTRVAP
jgi:hypothetical protein